MEAKKTASQPEGGATASQEFEKNGGVLFIATCDQGFQAVKLITPTGIPQFDVLELSDTKQGLEQDHRHFHAGTKGAPPCSGLKIEKQEK